jgi:hypothetical protein
VSYQKWVHEGHSPRQNYRRRAGSINSFDNGPADLVPVETMGGVCSGDIVRVDPSQQPPGARSINMDKKTDMKNFPEVNKPELRTSRSQNFLECLKLVGHLLSNLEFSANLKTRLIESSAITYFQSLMTQFSSIRYPIMLTF